MAPRFALLAASCLLATCRLGAAKKLDMDTTKPFGKVLELLQGMKTELAKEGKDDEGTHAKMSSWCADTKEDKTRTISESDTTIELQTASVKENKANGERLSFEIRTLTKEVASNKATLAKAEALRTDQRDAFAKDETSLKENIEAVSAAVAAFAVSGSSLLQSEGAMARLKLVVENNYDKIRARANRAERALLEDFLKDPAQFAKGTGFLQKQGAEADGPVETVVGLLQAMVGDFQRDLQEEQEKDAQLEKSYQALVEAKTSEVTAGKEQISAKEQQKATAGEKVATGTEDIGAATKTKAEAEKLLATTTEKCAASAAEFEQRRKTRSEELGAVSKAVEALHGEESLLSTGASFLQLRAVDQRAARAAEVLSSAGRRLRNQEMVTLSLQVKGDGMLKVKEAIDGMVRSLKQQQKDEVKEHDGCQKDFGDNKASTETKTELKETTDGKLSQLQADIATTEDAITKLKADSDEMQKQLKAATQNRDKERSEFADMVAEQQHTQQLLGEALEALKSFYTKPSLVQVREHRARVAEEPKESKAYENNAGGAKVMALIQEVSDDSAKLEAEAKQGDEDSRIAFEKLSEETKAEMASATKEIGSKSIQKADLEADVAEAKQTMRLTKDELDSLADTKAALHKSCDFVVNNFELRQKSRGDEIKALEEAKTILG